MGIVKFRKHYYFVMRVPKRFAHVDPRAQVRRALFTDSESEARAKEPAIRAEFIAYWEALAAGEGDDAAAVFDAAKRLAATRGFSYRPATDMAAAASLDDILSRLDALIRADGSYAPLSEGMALLGGVAPPPTRLTEALSEMIDFSAFDRLSRFSNEQRKRWRQPREAAVADFIAVIGEDRSILEITRADAQAFRKWLDSRITGPDQLTRNTANKKIGFLSDLFRTWTEYHAITAENPFTRLRFRDDQRRIKRHPFSEDWIRGRLLAPGALDGLNEEARDVFLMMINTGARPNEIIGANPADFVIEAEIPYLDIRENENRAVKTETSPRQIPRLGVSLDAARRISAQGGISRHVGKSDSWSAAVGKYLRERGLREMPEHTAYCLRPSFEDRMTQAGVDDRIRAERMGHKYERPDL